jgi:hypothetical protein
VLYSEVRSRTFTFKLLSLNFVRHQLAFRIRIRDPESDAFLTPGFGILILDGKIPEPGSGIRYLLNPESGMEKIGSGINISDPHTDINNVTLSKLRNKFIYW